MSGKLLRTKNPTIVFVHGLWLPPSSWEAWETYFRARGYQTLSVSWPGEIGDATAARQDSQSLAGVGVKQICDTVATTIAQLDQPPILIGHSFGGLVVQELLGRGVATAAVAIDPAPIWGVHATPLSTLRSFSPFLANPFNINRATMLSFRQFRYGFANAVSEEEARSLYDKYIVPAPIRPLFEVLFATFGLGKANRVDTAAHRGPLLIIGGERDHNAPPVFGRATLSQYTGNSITEYKEFTNRGHSLTITLGWQEVVEYCADWGRRLLL